MPVLDAHILAALSRLRPSHTLPSIIRQYNDNAGKVLKYPLPYEPTPGPNRRAPRRILDPSANSNEAENSALRDGLVLVAHAARRGSESEITLASGFAVDITLPGEDSETNVILSCAHTLEQIRRSKLADVAEYSGSFVVHSQENIQEEVSLARVTTVPSSLPFSDLILLEAPGVPLPTLPVSPYPAPIGTRILAHFVSTSPSLVSMAGASNVEWQPWIGGLWGAWVRGVVRGYRDFYGNDAKPGTYDTLAHLSFDPLPTECSSGGPIIDESSGSVVGVVRGTKMDSRIEGVRGWGVPAERIFEMFQLPGLEFSDV